MLLWVAPLPVGVWVVLDILMLEPYLPYFWLSGLGQLETAFPQSFPKST